MSKASSGLFKIQRYNSYYTPDWNTSIVWKHMEITQSEYGGTQLPRSFNIDTLNGKFWTHNNATKHMHEAILSLKDNPRMKNTNPKLYTQFILYEYWRALQDAVQHGVTFEKKVYAGKWEFIFSKPRKEGDNPVVKHAKFTGI
ncbi:MAG: hypothetical protein IKS10_08325 [Lachnospiraceae bacterium]|nr:hypothetical protein [Lachnospiraceae bacterium]